MSPIPETPDELMAQATPKPTDEHLFAENLDLDPADARDAALLRELRSPAYMKGDRAAVLRVREMLEARHGAPAVYDEVGLEGEVMQARQWMGVSAPDLPRELQEVWDAGAPHEIDFLTWADGQGLKGETVQAIVDFYGDVGRMGLNVSSSGVIEEFEDRFAHVLSRQQRNTLIRWAREAGL